MWVVCLTILAAVTAQTASWFSLAPQFESAFSGKIYSSRKPEASIFLFLPKTGNCHADCLDETRALCSGLCTWQAGVSYRYRQPNAEGWRRGNVFQNLVESYRIPLNLVSLSSLVRLSLTVCLIWTVTQTLQLIHMSNIMLFIILFLNSAIIFFKETTLFFFLINLEVWKRMR